MNAEFFSAIEDIEKEKGIPRQYMYEKIHQAMLAAFRKDNPEAADNVVIEMSEEKRKIDMYILKDVVEEVENPATQISEEAAKSDGWLILRFSGTEPRLRIFAEAGTMGEAEALVDIMARYVGLKN